MKVPLLVKFPGQKEKINYPTVTSHLDLVPSILSYCALPRDADELKGISFAEKTLALISSEAPTDQQPVRTDTLIMNSTIHTLDKDLVALRLLLGVRISDLPNINFDSIELRFLEEQNFYRGIFDGRYKFVRYFKPTAHHTPVTWSELLEHNELELFDCHNDPHELNNLALAADEHQDMILSLNARLNALIEQEIGHDDGQHMPGPEAIWRLS